LAWILDVARRRAGDEGPIDARFAQAYPFPDRSFHVVISQTGAMFFDDPVATFGKSRLRAAAGRASGAAGLPGTCP
jgi:hypothetical protein